MPSFLVEAAFLTVALTRLVGGSLEEEGGAAEVLVTADALVLVGFGTTSFFFLMVVVTFCLDTYKVFFVVISDS